MLSDQVSKLVQFCFIECSTFLAGELDDIATSRFEVRGCQRFDVLLVVEPEHVSLCQLVEKPQRRCETTGTRLAVDHQEMPFLQRPIHAFIFGDGLVSTANTYQVVLPY